MQRLKAVANAHATEAIRHLDRLAVTLEDMQMFDQSNPFLEAHSLMVGAVITQLTSGVMNDWTTSQL